ncbi:MAG: hypothetical protein COX49_06885 [bacterium (Candidatus Stahlbacteria) CG23_combo_of_CG06-09_8_20_14_all_40_9]|nr:MAG: hypothetical protein COX49_06885 [bacterium (Candidatus Stahlbacteria) CG23_combo_of_CG06-09_8_20_14_all_40_9]
MEHLLNSAIYTWFILPLLIFLARILDVSLGTIRLIFISKGVKYLAPLIGFFEVLIWLLAIGQIMKNLNNVVCYIAYGGGFALGTFLGIFIEEKLSIGMILVRIITQRDATELISFLQLKGYGVTRVNAEGAYGDVMILFSIIRRTDLKEVVDVITKLDPKAFYSIEDVRFVSEGIFPLKKSGYSGIYLRLFRRIRKGK